MKKNQNIANVMKKYAIILVFFCLWEMISFVILNTIVYDRLFNNELSDISSPFIMPILNLFIALISIIIDLSFLKKILDLRPLLSVRPVKCLIEDFIITTSYTADDKKSYKVSLLLKNPQTQELLFSYGKYSLSYYNYTYSKSGPNLMGINIFRKDGSTAEIGDEVCVYISKFVDVNITSKNGILRLNNKKFNYTHINQNYDISTFENVRFYEGAVEVEKEYCC